MTGTPPDGSTPDSEIVEYSPRKKLAVLISSLAGVWIIAFAIGHFL